MASARILLALLWLLLPGAASAAGEAVATNLPAITVSPVERATLVDSVRATGLIHAVERVLVQPQIEGQAIETIAAEVGDRVEAGDELARLSDAALVLQRSQLQASRASTEASIAQAEAQLAEAEALRDEANRVRERAVSLAERGATTRAAAEEAVANATGAEARVAAARQALNASRAQLGVVDAQLADVDLQLRRTSITAPVAGEVVERNAMVGAIASMAAEPMFAIVRDGLLEVRADVAEGEVLRLRPGQRVSLAVVGVDTPLAGTVRLVEPTVDATTRLGRVRVAVDDPGLVRSGMFADAEIIVEEKEALAVPASAIGRDEAGATALRVRDGVVERVPVTTGIRDGDLVEIASGLAEGDAVVSRAGAFVRDGDRINPVPAATAAAAN